MVSTRTVNRRRKVELLKGCLNQVIELLMLQDKERDTVNMKEFKTLAIKVKSMLEIATSLKPNAKKIYQNE